jgi:hypothetical protein
MDPNAQLHFPVAAQDIFGSIFTLFSLLRFVVCFSWLLGNGKSRTIQLESSANHWREDPLREFSCISGRVD